MAFSYWIFGSLGKPSLKSCDNIALTILCYSPRYYSYLDTYVCWNTEGLITGINILSAVVVALWRSTTGLVELDQVVMHIIFITLESAALPTTCMAIAVGLYHASPVSSCYQYYILRCEDAQRRMIVCPAHERPSRIVFCSVDRQTLCDRDAAHTELSGQASREDEITWSWSNDARRVAVGPSHECRHDDEKPSV